MEKKMYDVFISYSRKDYVDEHNIIIPGNVVSLIKEALSNAGISYWFDEEGIHHGEDFAEKIVNNIDSSQLFLFISTENSNKSIWTSREIACADELMKHIIPVRIDKTPYNKKVLFRISDLDYINYYANPDKGVDDLITSINVHLDQLKEEEEIEKKKQEELRLQKEKEYKQMCEEQQKLIHSIKISCKTLNNKEAKIELDREDLMLKTDSIVDEEQKESIKKMILDSAIHYKKYQTEVNNLNETIEHLLSDKKQLEDKIESLNKIIREKEEINKNIESTTKSDTDFIDISSVNMSFVVTDIEIANEDLQSIILTDYGSPLISNDTMFLSPRITYLGIKPCSKIIYYKLFQPNGLLASTSSYSPKGYTSSIKVEIKKGSHKVRFWGWGSNDIGFWSAGKYRIEIWCDNKMMAERTFEIL